MTTTTSIGVGQRVRGTGVLDGTPREGVFVRASGTQSQNPRALLILDDSGQRVFIAASNVDLVETESTPAVERLNPSVGDWIGGKHILRDTEHVGAFVRRFGPLDVPEHKRAFVIRGRSGRPVVIAAATATVRSVRAIEED